MGAWLELSSACVSAEVCAGAMKMKKAKKKDASFHCTDRPSELTPAVFAESGAREMSF